MTVLSPRSDALYQLLKADAARGLPCPSDRQIQARLGWPGNRSPHGYLQTLESKGLIEYVRSTTWRRRQITIVATGHATAGEERDYRGEQGLTGESMDDDAGELDVAALRRRAYHLPRIHQSLFFALLNAHPGIILKIDLSERQGLDMRYNHRALRTKVARLRQELVTWPVAIRYQGGGLGLVAAEPAPKDNYFENFRWGRGDLSEVKIAQIYGGRRYGRR